MEQNKQSLSALCKSIRSYLGWSQEEMASHLGKHQATVGRYEKGRAIPPGHIVVEYMRLLNNKGDIKNQ